MKKAIKKLMAALLAVAMLCALAVPAFADDGTAPASTGATGSIKVENAVAGKTYKIYKILDLETNAPNYNAFKYKAASDWESFVNSNAYLDVGTDGYVTWKGNKTDDDVKAFAKAAKAVAASMTPTKPEEMADATGVVNFTGLELGYYLVTSDVDTSNDALCMLDTTTPDMTVKEKNGKPTIEKKIDVNGTLSSSNDATVGDTVKFIATIHVTDGDPQNYVMHDTMSTGLAFIKDSVVVKRGTTTFTGGSEYTLDPNAGTDSTGAYTFKITFTNNILKTNDVITVEYSATLTKDAIIGSDGNPNDVRLDYTNGYDTDHTKTYTWSFDVYKFHMNGTVEERLAGAEFELYRKNGEETEYAQFDGNKISGWTKTESEAGKRISDTSSNIKIEGLANGTYYLKETKAPAGYTSLGHDIAVTIDANNLNNLSTASATVSYNSETATDGVVKVENKAGTTLPGTGGIGTTIFYVVGGGLMVAAAVLLITKKRMENKN